MQTSSCPPHLLSQLSLCIFLAANASNRPACSRSEARGSGLSLATAGVSASVSVTLRDRFENYQPNVAVGSITLQLNNDAAACAVTDCSSGGCPSTVAGPFITSPPFVAFPSAAPVYVLTYVVTSSGHFSLAVLGTKTFSAANAKLANSVLDAPFELSVTLALPCESMSTFTASAFDAQPAQLLSLTSISRDAYGNPRATAPLATARSFGIADFIGAMLHLCVLVVSRFTGSFRSSHRDRCLW
jgi:hypothetical protein